MNKVKTSFFVTEETTDFPDEAVLFLPSIKHSGGYLWPAGCSGLEATQKGVVEDFPSGAVGGSPPASALLTATRENWHAAMKTQRSNNKTNS